MTWLRQLLFRRRLYSELSDEIQQHLNERVDELVENGTPRQEAVFAARREFGNVAGKKRLKHRNLDQGGLTAVRRSFRCYL